MAEKVVLAADGSVQASLNNLRKVVTGDNFIVFGYEGKNILKVIAEGPGFVDAAKEYLIPTECRYVLLRKEHRVELASTVKFAFIDYTPDNLPPTRRALLSTHKGQFRDLLGQTHVVHQAGDLSDVSEEIILDKIGMSAGTKINATDKAAWTHESKASAALAAVGGGTGAKGVDIIPQAAVSSNTGVRLADEAAAKAAIADVRKDATETNWALFNYANDTTIQLVATGTGGVEELITRLDDTQVFYAFFRTTAQQDKTTKVIFCSLKLLSMAVSTVARAKIATHKGFVDALFTPVHNEFTCTSPSDFTVEVVAERVAAITLTASHLVAAGHAETVSGTMLHRPKQSEVKTPAALVPMASSGVSWENFQAYQDAMAAIKAGTISWFVARWAAKDVLALAGTGTGDIDEAVATLEADNVNFIYQRIIDRVDKTDAVKFVSVKVQPETVSAMKKGQVNTKKGAIDAFFQPAHVSFQAASAAEVNADIVRAKVQAAAGTKNNVF